MSKARKATHPGKLYIGDVALDCAVLEDKTRVLSQRAITKALGGKRGGSHWRRAKKNPDGANLPVYLSASNLIGFIDDELKEMFNNPIEYQVKSGATATGLYATALPKVCDAYLRAREAGALHPSQIHIAQQAETLMRGFAHIGIIALIDEATGYQEEREKDELNAMLSAYLSEERLKWARFFPIEFYKQIYRLNDWRWPPVQSNRYTPKVGAYTNEVVYERLPEGVLPKLKELNPVNPTTRRRRWKYTQFLSEDLGQPDLKNHLLQVIALMRAAPNWKAFLRLLDRSLPKKGAYHLPLEGID